MSHAAALQLVDELRAAGRISPVEASALQFGLAATQADVDIEDWLVPRTFDPEAMRTWVRRVCVEMDLNPSRLAQLAGIQPSTLNRFLARDDDANISASTLHSIILTCRSQPAASAQRRRIVQPDLKSTSAVHSRPELLCTIADVFDRFHGASALGRAIGKGQSTASEMKRRGSIPIEHWPALIAAGREIGLDLDEAALVRLHLATPAREAAP